MKKTVFLGSWICVFVTVLFAEARPINETEARQVALNWMAEKSGRQQSESDLTTAAIERNGPNAVYYVINFARGGWIIISGDDVAYPVVAFSYQGTYSTAEDDRPVQFNQWMGKVAAEIHNAVVERSVPLPEAQVSWSRLNVDSESFTPAPLLDFDIAPLLTTTWDQGTYYNASCPADAAGPGGHVWAGCVATAMAQVMKYHNYPATGFGSHSYVDASYGNQQADFGATTYNWTSMPDSLSTYNADVATLLYHAGVSVEMAYGTDGSGASTSDAATALKTYFKYSDKLYFASKTDYTDTEWQTLLQTELNNGRPIIYRGDGSGGHSFVCDGLLGEDYFHFNWGWSGDYNGYFYLNDLTPGSHDYTNNQGGIMGITPAVVNLTYPYGESFEEGMPSDWSVNGTRASLVTDDAQDGTTSLRLSSPAETNFNEENYAVLNINVPEQGGELSFWVKRGYNPDASDYNQQSAWLETQFGGTVLYSFYDGDFNDSQWVQLSKDLSPWAGSNIKLIVQQFNSSTTYYQWTSLDNVSITTTTNNITPLPAIMLLLLGN
ncbi:MAG: C10 family peptidase [Candidatus Electrothrix sp. GW3-4]|uniref:C10 family peptidase n=1 Tax=Candidatus Electrothrix sp. GW3-4 TaxID=3126740 RepID=UPI0030D534BC